MEGVSDTEVLARILDHGGGGVLLDRQDAHLAHPADIYPEFLAGCRMGHGIGNPLHCEFLARPYPLLASLVDVDDVALAEGQLLEFTSDYLQAAVLGLWIDIPGAVQVGGIGHRHQRRRPGRPWGDRIR